MSACTRPTRGALVPALLAISALTLPLGIRAELALEPQTGCSLLEAERLGGLKYHDLGQGVFRCVSPRRKLRYGGDVQNEMQFQAWGAAGQVNRLELHVKTFGLENVQPTLKAMAEMGETLTQQAVGESLPEAIRAGILASTPAQASAGVVRFSVLRRTAGMGGQDLILRIE